jgi:hypothetical protein
MGKGFNLYNTNMQINMHGTSFELVIEYKNLVYGIHDLKPAL